MVRALVDKWGVVDMVRDELLIRGVEAMMRVLEVDV